MRLIVTTTRRANPRVRSLAKELALSLYSALRINRGKMSLPELAAVARSYGAVRVIIVCRGLYGNPGRLLFLDTSYEEVRFFPLILALSGVKLAREQGVKPTPPPSQTPVVPSPSIGENADFAQELAAALDLPYLEVESVGELSPFCHRALVVEWVGSERTKHVIKFVSCSSGEPEGPKLFVRKAVYRALTYEEVAGSLGPESGHWGGETS